MPSESGTDTATDVPVEFVDLLERPISAVMTTVLPDDTLHGTVVWIDYDGTRVLVNTAKGRRKVKNVRRDPRVSFVIVDADTDYRYLWISGIVEEISNEGATDHADELARQYLAAEEYPYHDTDSQRLILKIRPSHCRGFENRNLIEE